MELDGINMLGVFIQQIDVQRVVRNRSVRKMIFEYQCLAVLFDTYAKV